jgi:hypothetical protein
MEKTVKPLVPSPELRDIFLSIASWDGMEGAIKILENLYDSYLNSLDNGCDHDNNNHLIYLQFKNIVRLLEQGKKDFGLM